MDLQMPEMNGLDAVIAIRGEFPEAKIIVLTTYTGDVQVLRALKAGARAYLLKISCIRNSWRRFGPFMRARRPCRPKLPLNSPSMPWMTPNSNREVAILRLIAGGNANKQIADQLSITEDTVKGRIKSILSKLKANDRTQAATVGLKRGIIEL